MERVYLDWNATTPLSAAARSAMNAVEEKVFGNPASIHAEGRLARSVVEDARAEVGALASADARDVLFVSGGTEANNLALRAAFSPPSTRRTLVTSRLEHPSVTRVAEALEREGKARVHWLAVRSDGAIDLDDLDRVLAEGDVAVVCVMAVNHETGVIQPIDEVIARAHHAQAKVHVDAVQAWGKVIVPAGADSYAVAAHKIRGPKGIGALVTRPGLALAPVLVGGAQERGLRPGTVSPALAAGFGAAATEARGKNVQDARITGLRDRLEAGLVALGARPLGGGLRVAHVTCCIFPGWVGAELVAALDLEGVAVSSGAACSAGTVEASPVVAAVAGDAHAASSIRASLGETTSEDDVTRAIEAFGRVVARARKKPRIEG